MGLEVSHGCYVGGYISYQLWRDVLAKSADYKFKLYPGDWREAPIIDWDNVTNQNLNGIWDECPEDPLVIIIAHHDTEGLIEWEHLKKLIVRLEEIYDRLPKHNNNLNQKHINNRMRELTRAFITGMKLAYKNKEDITYK